MPPHHPPALANVRVQRNAVGQVVLNLKAPWREGTTHLAMSVLELMQLPIERPFCGDQIHWLYVSSGSKPPVQVMGKLSLARCQ